MYKLFLENLRLFYFLNFVPNKTGEIFNVSWKCF